VAQSRIDVRADSNDDDDMDIEVPDPPDPPDPPAVMPHAPAAPRAPKAPTAPKAKCAEPMDVHVAPMVFAMPKISIPPIDIHLDQAMIEEQVRRGMAMKKMSTEMAAKMATMQRDMLGRRLEPSQKYKDALRGAGIKADEHETRQLYMMGVSPRYVQSLREAGLKNLTAHDVIRLHAMGITPNFLKELRRMQQ
jgi:hypothetical protein